MDSKVQTFLRQMYGTFPVYWVACFEQLTLPIRSFLVETGLRNVRWALIGNESEATKFFSREDAEKIIAEYPSLPDGTWRLLERKIPIGDTDEQQ